MLCVNSYKQNCIMRFAPQAEPEAAANPKHFT